MLTTMLIMKAASVSAFIYTHWADIAAAAAAFHLLAQVIVNLTETPKDDAIVAKVYRVIEVVGGIVTKRAKL